MKLLIGVVLVAVIVGGYALARPWLKVQPWAAGFFRLVEPLELALFKNSETILFARLKIVLGLLLTVLTQLGSMDLTPLLPYVPEAHRALVQFCINLLPLGVTIIGMMDEKLRNGTTKPLELVALPTTKPLPPAVVEAVALADQTKREAVQVVKDEQPNA